MERLTWFQRLERSEAVERLERLERAQQVSAAFDGETRLAFAFLTHKLAHSRVSQYSAERWGGLSC